MLVAQFVANNFVSSSQLTGAAPAVGTRRALRLGTCLSGAAAALMLMAPGGARASEACGAPIDGVVTCPASGVDLSGGVHYVVNPTTPQDLTINLGDGLSIDTGGSNNAGIHVANLNGSVTINGQGTSIVTSGTGASGISGATYVGDLTIHAGDIATSGYQGNGIVASASVGNVTITASNVSTSGDNAYGITVLSDREGSGDVSIDVGSVATAGNSSKGIEVVGLGGSVDISVGDVSTSGDNSTAIQAIAMQDLTIKADSVTTSGKSSHGVYGIALLGDANITVGNVSTSGENSAGIIAASIYGDANVTVNDVLTTGNNSIGIYAFSQAGNTTVNAGYVTTGGYYASPGIQAISISGDATVNAHEVFTHGDNSTAIEVFAGGTAAVNVENVYAQGHYSNGITAVGGNAQVHVTGNLATNGYGSYGIVAVGQSGDASVLSEGQIITTNAGSTGILAIANGNVSVDSNKLFTNSYYSTGIQAVAHGGNVTVNANLVSTKGDLSGGIVAAAVPSDPYDSSGHDVTVTAGTVTTAGTGSSGITAVNFTNGGNATVNVTEMVETRRDYSHGAVAYSQTGTATVNVKNVSTRGFFSIGVNADGATAVVNATGDISTLGDFSAGIRGYSTSGGVTITNAGTLSTAGRNSYGIVALGFGPLSVTNSGSIETSGQFGHGVYAIASPGENSSVSILNSGSIIATGERANGIRGIGKGAGVTIASTGTVTVTGERAVGIVALGDRGGRGYAASAVAQDKMVSVTAASVVTTGSGSLGVLAANYNGDVVVDIDKISATGANSRGMIAQGVGTVGIKARDITSTASAIYALGQGDVDVNVTGNIQSTGDSAIVATSRGGDTTVNVDSGATVIGGGHREEWIAGGNGITVASWEGKATVNNAGFVTTTGDGYAIEIVGFADQVGRQGIINNSGRIEGAIRVTQLDDTFINSGTFEVTKSSKFDLGNDIFTNSGTVKLKTAVAADISFEGLELFDNQGGLVDLTNDHGGDVFTLPGDYVGNGDARLALDVAGSKADQLVVLGAATGKTKIQLSNIGGGNALLTGDDPIVIIKTGEGSDAGAFELGSSNVGFIQYHLAFDVAAGTYGLVGTAGNGVYRAAKIGEGLQSVWHKSADAWTAHVAELRDAGGGEPERRLWSQAFGQVDKRDEERSFAIGGGGEEIYDLGYRQNYYGGQLGYDMGNGGPFSWGLTAGYAGSKLDHAGPGESAKYGVFNLGAYAGYASGKFFANALLKYDHSSIKATSETSDYSDRFNGGSFGARIEAGARLGSDGFFVEPLAGLSWLSTSIDDLEALGQVIDFDRLGGLRGKLGGRIGGVSKNASGSVLTFYGGASIVHEFDGDDGAKLISGGATDHADNKPIGTYGQGMLGLNFQSSGRVSGFIEANGELGGGYKGAGGRIGTRIKL